MKRIYLKWTETELNFLKENYNSQPKDYLINHLRNRKWGAITKKAQILKLSNWERLNKLSDISILLEETPASYYWMGFLMADGSFTDRRIYIGTSQKDLSHLLKFKKYIKSTNKMMKLKNEDHYRFKVTSVNEVRKLKNKFHISSRKTYEPCNLQFIENQELLFSLIVGLIDGDGCVYKVKHCNSYRLSFNMHSSWVNNLNYIKSFLYSYFKELDKTRPARVKSTLTYMPQDKTKTKREYQLSFMSITKRSLLQKLKTKAIDLDIPFMDRKIGKIQ